MRLAPLEKGVWGNLPVLNCTLANTITIALTATAATEAEKVDELSFSPPR
jgi:hypothetical protein